MAVKEEGGVAKERRRQRVVVAHSVAPERRSVSARDSRVDLRPESVRDVGEESTKRLVGRPFSRGGLLSLEALNEEEARMLHRVLHAPSYQVVAATKATWHAVFLTS